MGIYDLLVPVSRGGVAVARSAEWPCALKTSFFSLAVNGALLLVSESYEWDGCEDSLVAWVGRGRGSVYLL